MPTTVQPTTAESGNKKKDALRSTTQEFEAIFIQQMLQAMRKTVPEGGLLEKNNATRIYEDMLDAEYARLIARQQSLGLAAAMERQIEHQRNKK